MESQPILYGKDVNTGAITQLNSIGNLLMLSNKLNDLSDVIITTPSTGQSLRYNGTNWVNAAKDDYIHINVFGSAPSNLYSSLFNLYQFILLFTLQFWASPVPNPYQGVGGYVSSNNLSLSSGWVKLNTSKKYRIDATASFNGFNISAIANWQCIIATKKIINGTNRIIAYSYSTQMRDLVNLTLHASVFHDTPAIADDDDLYVTLATRISSAEGGTIEAVPDNKFDSAFTLTVQEI